MEAADKSLSGASLPYKDIGDRLAEVRQSLGMTKKDFAESLGVNPVSYLRYEDGSRQDVLVIKQASVVYGVDLNWLLTGKGAMYSKPQTQSLDKAEDVLTYANALPQSEVVRLVQLIVGRFAAA